MELEEGWSSGRGVEESVEFVASAKFDGLLDVVGWSDEVSQGVSRSHKRRWGAGGAGWAQRIVSVNVL